MATRTLHQTIGRRTVSTLAESVRPHIASIPERSVLQITGKDAQKFLKGLTCRDVDKSPGWGYSGFLTPTVSVVRSSPLVCLVRRLVDHAMPHTQGRVLYDAFIYPTSTPDEPTQSYLIDYPTPSTANSSDTETPLLAKHLKRYVLRSKVKLRDVTEEYDTWSILDSTLGGDGSSWVPGKTWKMEVGVPRRSHGT
jgi:folate-binding Fe-S cluster repair protein YgfZ